MILELGNTSFLGIEQIVQWVYKRDWFYIKREKLKKAETKLTKNGSVGSKFFLL